MKRASLAAAFAASLLLGSVSAAIAADEARLAEERLLGSDRRGGAVRGLPAVHARDRRGRRRLGSLDAALAQAGVPAAAMLEARQAFAGLIDLDRDVQPGDRFYVRYEQTFTVEGAPIGIGRVLWAELRTKAKGTIAIHRFPQPRQERALLAGERPGGDAARRCACRSRPSRSRRASGCAPIRSTSRRRRRPASPAPMGGPQAQPRRCRRVCPAGGTQRRRCGDGPYGDAARRALGLVALRRLAGGAAAPGGAVAVHARRRRSRGAGRHAGPCRGRRRRWSAPRPTAATATGSASSIGGKLATVYGHLSAFAPGIEPGMRWRAAS